MNFMKRTEMLVNAAIRTQLEGSGNAVTEMPKKPLAVHSSVQEFDDDPNCTVNSLLSEERYTVLEKLRFGRFSFKGQNPEIEKVLFKTKFQIQIC